MQSELLNISLNWAAAALPKRIRIPRQNVCNFKSAPGRFRASALQPDSLLDKIADMAEKPDLSEDDMVQLFEMAKSFFDGLDRREIADEEEMEMAKQQISCVTGLLSTASYGMARRYKTDLKSLQNEKIRLIREKERIFSDQKEDEHRLKEYLAKYDALEARLKQLEQDVDTHMKEIIQARKDLEDIQAKEDELEKWCWVPFYNIYLYVDSEKAASRYNVCKNRLETAQRQRNNLLQEKEALHNEMVFMQRMEAETRVRLISNKQSMNQCTKAIDQAKSKALQYSDYTVFFGNTNKRLEHQEGDAEMITVLLNEIRDLFGKVLCCGK